ncbi:hypothetical protein [Micromonospora sp. NPDC047738]|uniref:hypothetical protein n=1 Tax=unclassified Micromonospora TaxID=2617518 RepID=UPI0033CFB9A7
MPASRLRVAVGLTQAGRDAEFTLHGYTFTDHACLETVLTDVAGDDPAWLFAAWRSVTRSE